MPIDNTLLIPPVYQDTDSAIVENFTVPGGLTHALGSALSPIAYPLGATLIPKGAGSYSNLAAPTAGSAITTGQLVSNGHYTWSVTLVTIWGETIPGSLVSISVTGGGTGYGSTPTVVIGAPVGAGGVQATATATVSGGVVTGVTITNPGSGYTTAPAVSFSGGSPTTAATATATTNTLTITALGSGKTGQTIILPSYSVRADNPVLMLRLYRTTNNGTQLELIAEIDDLNTTTYVDEVSDTELTLAAPTSNTSGSMGAVTIYDGASYWTELPSGATLATKQFTVDYTVTATGGTVTFASADVGTPVTATYYAGTLLGSVFLNQHKTAFKSIYDFVRTDALARFYHNVKVDGNLEVAGTTTLDGTLTVVGATTLAALTASSLHITGTSALDGAVTINNTLHVTGNSQLDGTLTVNGNTSLGGTLGVTGATTLSSTLAVSGAATFSTTLGVTGAASVGGNFSVGGTLTVTGASTLNGGLTVTGNASVSGTFTSSGATTFNSLVTIGTSGGLHILGGPPDFQVANIFGSGSSVVTVGHTSNPQDLGVTGTTNLKDVHLANPSVLYTNFIAAQTASLTTVNDELRVNNWFHPVKILSNVGGTPSLLDASPGATILALYGGNNSDFAGIIHFKPGGTSSSGDQFRVTYSSNTVHSATPLVLLSQGTNISDAVVWFTSVSDATKFIVSAKTAPTSGVDYYIGYVVIN